MDVAQYIDEDPARMAVLAQRSRIQAASIRTLCADRTRPVRYMTARRLCAASGGAITRAALAARGAMAGADVYSGPLGERVATIASTGPDVAQRLAEAGIRREQFYSMMLRGFVPRSGNKARVMAAFPGVLDADFAEHAAWRRADVAGRTA